MSKFDAQRKIVSGPVGYVFFAGDTQSYPIEEARRAGFYVIGTMNWVALFSRNTCKVDWGSNDEHFCQIDSERVVEAARKELGIS